MAPGTRSGIAEQKRSRGGQPGRSGPALGNSNARKHGAWQVVAQVRGLRAAPRERLEALARTTAGLLSDLGAVDVLSLSTSKRLVLESVIVKVEMRRAFEVYLLSRTTPEEFRDALAQVLGAGHYLALCNSIKADLDKLGAWVRVPLELEAIDGAGRLADLRRRFKTPALGPGQAQEPQPLGGARGPGAKPEPVLGPPGETSLPMEGRSDNIRPNPATSEPAGDLLSNRQEEPNLPPNRRQVPPPSSQPDAINLNPPPRKGDRSPLTPDPAVGAEVVELLDAEDESKVIDHLEPAPEEQTKRDTVPLEPDPAEEAIDELEACQEDVGDGTACTDDAVVKWDEEVPS